MKKKETQKEKDRIRKQMVGWEHDAVIAIGLLIY